MVIATNWSTHSSGILIQGLVTILNLIALFKFIFDYVHVFLRCVGGACGVLLEF